MSVLLKTSVGEIAAATPDAARLFDAVGIDYACHGNLSLHDACASAGLDPVQIRRSVEELPRHGGFVNWLAQPLGELQDHLRRRCHPAVSAALASMIEVLEAPCQTCKAYPAQIAELRRLCESIIGALRPHVRREEGQLFPAIENLDALWSRGETPTVTIDTALAPSINALMLDHASMIGTLDAMRAAGEEIITADERCEELGTALRALDHELRNVVHLENNILFPRALALEAIASPATAGSRVRT